jgi:hypothetical protein
MDRAAARGRVARRCGCRDERPNLYTGARIVPDSIWLPQIPATPPAGAKALFDFEAGTWEGGRWTRSGPAWGNGPVTTALPGQDLVLGASGTRFATSMHDGDKTTGRITSPAFSLDASKLTMRLGGGSDATKLRVEPSSAMTVDRASVLPGGDSRRPCRSRSVELRGKIGTLVLVDDNPTATSTSTTCGRGRPSEPRGSR